MFHCIYLSSGKLMLQLNKPFVIQFLLWDKQATYILLSRKISRLWVDLLVLSHCYLPKYLGKYEHVLEKSLITALNPDTPHQNKPSRSATLKSKQTKPHSLSSPTKSLVGLSSSAFPKNQAHKNPLFLPNTTCPKNNTLDNGQPRATARSGNDSTSYQ